MSQQRYMPKESKEILQLITELGCMSESQIAKMLKGQVKNMKYYVDYLSRDFIEQYSEGIFVPRFVKKFDPTMLHCIWVLLDNDISVEVDDKSFFRAENPAQVSFLKDNTMYELVYLNKENLDGYSIFLQERFYKRYPKWVANSGNAEPFKYLFVITDIEVLDMLQEAEIIVPNKVAHVQYGANSSVPQIDYYG